MKVFNKNKAEHKLKLKQNKNKYIKYTTIGLSCLILVIGIIMFTFAYLETKIEYTIINGTVGAVKKEVVLNANGGTLDNNTIKLTLGEVITNLPIPTRSGYELEGWYLDNGLTQKVTNETLMNKNITNLYAKWNKYPIIVSGNLNTVGSVVRIANEEFYVIGQQDSTHVKLLSKWNLNVGSNAKGTATNKQDEDVRGYIFNGTKYGNVAFSSTDYWHNFTPVKKAKDEYGGYTYNTNTESYTDGQGNVVYPYVYDNNSNIKQYVDTYVTYLNTQGVNVSGRLIKQEELVALGCNASTHYCDSNEEHGGTAPSWVYQTSYWSGSAFDYSNVWLVASRGTFISSSCYSDYLYGVRPVIILEK